MGEEQVNGEAEKACRVLVDVENEGPEPGGGVELN